MTKLTGPAGLVLLVLITLGGWVNFHFRHNTPGMWVWDGGSLDIWAAEYTTGIGKHSSENQPGARTGMVGWTDASGTLWLFGGEGYDETAKFGLLNNLWSFNPNTRQWSWVSGDKLVNAKPRYGQLDTTSPGNHPGGRESAVAWTDAKGRLWLFGGNGFDVNGSYGSLNDLWVFDTNIQQWTWVDGPNTVRASAAYGTRGVASAGNRPGSRIGAASWRDEPPRVWRRLQNLREWSHEEEIEVLS